MQEKTLGEIIAEKRRERRLTQAALASHLGISDKAVSKWERNLSRPEGNHMVELVELLDLPREFLPQGGLRLVDTEETEYLPPLFDAQQDKSEAGPQTWRLSLYDAVVIVVAATLLAVSVGTSTGLLAVEQSVPIIGSCNALLALVMLGKENGS